MHTNNNKKKKKRAAKGEKLRFQTYFGKKYVNDLNLSESETDITQVSNTLFVRNLRKNIARCTYSLQFRYALNPKGQIYWI